MPLVNLIRVPASVTKAIREKSVKTLALRVIMVLAVWRNVVVKMVALVIMYQVNVCVHLVLQDHCKLLKKEQFKDF